MSEFKIGDLVHIKPEYAKTVSHRTSTYKVEKINPRTIGLVNTQSGGKMKADPEFLAAGLVPEKGATVELIGQPYVPVVFLDNGTVVRPNEKAKRRGVKDGLYVVTGEVTRGYRIYPLGGSTRYYTGIPSDQLDVVQPKDVSEFYAAKADA